MTRLQAKQPVILSEIRLAPERKADAVEESLDAQSPSSTSSLTQSPFYSCTLLVGGATGAGCVRNDVPQ